MPDYVHGYSEEEARRLHDQADTLTDLLHHDTRYPEGSLVLEAGCGVGAQTKTLAKNSPLSRFVSVDISPESIGQAEQLIRGEGITNVTFQVADIFNLPFHDCSFDHIFVCFVLEHLSDPVRALSSVKRVLRPGGTITVIEGDHGSTFFHPDSKEAHMAIDCLVRLQAEAGGNANIGRQLYPLLRSAGYRDVRVSPRFVYVDSSRPRWVDGFTKKTFTAMVKEVGDKVLEKGMMKEEEWKKGIADLYRTAGEDGTFCYTFFKAIAIK